MESGAVVVPQWLGHEGGRLARHGGGVPNQVAGPDQVIGCGDQWFGGEIKLALSGRGHPVVVAADGDAALGQRLQDLVAEFLQRIGRRDGQVSLAVPDPGGAGSGQVVASTPLALTTLDPVERFLFVLAEPDPVEDEKIDPWPHSSFVSQPKRLEVMCRFSGNIARILGIVLAGDRVLDIGQNRQGAGPVRVDECGFRLGNDQDVAFVDRLPSLQA